MTEYSSGYLLGFSCLASIPKKWAGKKRSRGVGISSSLAPLLMIWSCLDSVHFKPGFAAFPLILGYLHIF